MGQIDTMVCKKDLNNISWENEGGTSFVVRTA